MALGRFFEFGKFGKATLRIAASGESVPNTAGLAPAAPNGIHFECGASDGRIVVCDGALFSGVPVGPLGGVDREKLGTIARCTDGQRRPGKHPKFILTHADDAPGIGRVASDLRVSLGDKLGALTIFGDMALSEPGIAAHVARDRFPNCSAQSSINTERRACEPVRPGACHGRSARWACMRNPRIDSALRRLTLNTVATVVASDTPREVHSLALRQGGRLP